MNTQANRDQFLAGRKKGIGGSDVAAILGFSPYKSPYQLWLDKTGRSERKESQNESAHFGNLLEDVVAKEFSRRSGMKVQRVTQQLTLENIGESWAIGNIDRAVVNPEIAGRVYFDKEGKLTTDQGLECKTASEYVHCHTGSLENSTTKMGFTRSVHCHTGSLEKYLKTSGM